MPVIKYTNKNGSFYKCAKRKCSIWEKANSFYLHILSLQFNPHGKSWKFNYFGHDIRYNEKLTKLNSQIIRVIELKKKNLAYKLLCKYWAVAQNKVKKYPCDDWLSLAIISMKVT